MKMSWLLEKSFYKLIEILSCKLSQGWWASKLCQLIWYKLQLYFQVFTSYFYIDIFWYHFLIFLKQHPPVFFCLLKPSLQLLYFFCSLHYAVIQVLCLSYQTFLWKLTHPSFSPQFFLCCLDLFLSNTNFYFFPSILLFI